MEKKEFILCDALTQTRCHLFFSFHQFYLVNRKNSHRDTAEDSQFQKTKFGAERTVRNRLFRLKVLKVASVHKDMLVSAN